MERRALAVRGIVQGVGFRPFIHSLASELSLTGFVRNVPQGVVIEIEGPVAALDQFEGALASRAPDLADIEACERLAVPTRGDVGFRIDSSAADRRGFSSRVTPDIATCPDCFEELHDPANRRFRHPFITCARCGPRLTVVTGVPYDRERTTMTAFRMCAACRREFDDPHDRRFHAQTIACPACGPRLTLSGADGGLMTASPGVGDPLERAVAVLRDGGIVAVKGLGGYHLACDATDSKAVDTLRLRKQRDEKPFAVMFSSLDAVACVCELTAVERELLVAPARPIVLLKRRTGGHITAPVASVAPGCPVLGVMLPSTPLHALLVEAMERPLVMTSGNRSDEPTVYDDESAVEQLRGIADAFLTHDRRIHVRCDDGVSRVVGSRELPIRRSRGIAPRPIRLPIPGQGSWLAVGAQLKNTFALGRDRDAFVSHHIGDLDDLAAYQAFTRDIGLLQDLFEIRPAVLVHDEHPGYTSTRYAIERAAAEGLQTMAVQHHHAHFASCLAEHGMTGPAIGVAFDGSGHGADGTVWGGEFLVGDLCQTSRAAFFRTVPLPGGDQAVREPWRMALAHLLDAGDDASRLRARVDHATVTIVERMMVRGLNAPLTSSVGRLFDAVAAIAIGRDRVSYEGQAAMQLEWLASDVAADGAYEVCVEERGESLIVDTRPVIRGVVRDLARGAGPARVARRFHSTLAAVVAEVCVALGSRTGLDAVALTGGVFQNALLTTDCEDRLARAGFRVCRHHQVPPGDGGISLGQLAVAAARSRSCA
ncbi:MAG TPA: carbamoyltransferase HypF [Vicinamibacterales bacterium]|nr:carbamoyltransferase HypF [Vicinamibacterales bacterium]